MPWCDQCAKFWNPSSMSPAGACPTCGRVIARPPSVTAAPIHNGDAVGPATASGTSQTDDPARPRAPWHFKLMMVALVIYLAFRFIQGVAWVMHH